MAEKKSILLRLNPTMWEEINKWAEDEFRSVNGQIEYLLKEAIIKRNKSFKMVEETKETPSNEVAAEISNEYIINTSKSPKATN